MVVDIFTNSHLKEGICRSRKLDQEDGSVATSGHADGKSDRSIKKHDTQGSSETILSQSDASKLPHTLSFTEELYSAPHIHPERAICNLPLPQLHWPDHLTDSPIRGAGRTKTKDFWTSTWNQNSLYFLYKCSCYFCAQFISGCYFKIFHQCTTYT